MSLQIELRAGIRYAFGVRLRWWIPEAVAATEVVRLDWQYGGPCLDPLFFPASSTPLANHPGGATHIVYATWASASSSLTLTTMDVLWVESLYFHPELEPAVSGGWPAGTVGLPWVRTFRR